MSLSCAQLEAMAPLGILWLAPLVLVMLDAIFTRKERKKRKEIKAREHPSSSVKGFFLAAATASFLLSALFASGLNFEKTNPVVVLAHSMFVIDEMASFAMALLCISSLLILCHSLAYLPARGIDHAEYNSLFLIVVAGALALVCAGNLISLFVAGELMTIPLYVLVGFDRDRRGSSDTGMRALLMGGFASAISLYGIALLYGATGHFDYPGIRTAVDAAVVLLAGGRELGETTPFAMGLAGVSLLLVGILTRQGAAPFHQWLPEMTARAPAVVTIFFPAILATAAAFALIRLLDSIVAMSLPGFSTMFEVLSGVSLVVGSLLAWTQSSLKRLLAYGGVAQAGFLLAALAVRTPEARSTALLQITVFLFMQVGALGAISAMARRGKEWELLSDYSGLAEERPMLAAALTLFLLALAGFPGTAGFVCRFLVISVTVGSGQLLLTLLMTISSVILFAAYLRVPTLMYMEHANSPVRTNPVATEAVALPLPAVFALSVCAFVTLYVGLFPGPGPIPFEMLKIVRQAVQP